MISIFALPKAFEGIFEIIQNNAFKSWSKIFDPESVIIFGDENGVSDAVQKYGFVHHPYIERNNFGTPLVNFLFNKAVELSNDPVLAYVNSDIILASDFIQSVSAIKNQMNEFLIVGRRIDVDDTIQFTDIETLDKQIYRISRDLGNLHSENGIDYFVYNRDLFSKDIIPPFGIGRMSWDQWLVFHPFNKNTPVIDASKSITAIHQNHDYSHHKDGVIGVTKNSEEGLLNYKMAGGETNLYTIRDVRLELNKGNIIKKETDWSLIIYRWLISRKNFKSLWNLILNFLLKIKQIKGTHT
jgi:hypothetical protein